MSNASQKTRIVIVGGDISGAISAAMLARYLPSSHYDITYVMPEGVERSAFFAHIPPTMKALHRDLKIKELDFIRATHASFSLGEDVVGQHSGFIPYGPLGPILNNTEFHHVMHRVDKDRFYEAVLPAALARSNTFMLPQTEGPIILSGFDYGYHVDVSRYATVLAEQAARLGCTIIKGSATSVVRNEDLLTGIKLADGTTLSGDLFIDATGTKRLLSTREQNWNTAPNFPPAFTVTERASIPTAISPASRTEFRSDATVTEHQTQMRVVSVQCSEVGEPLNSGWVDQPWSGNVIAMGLAAMSLPPTQGWNIRAIYDQVRNLLAVCPRTGIEGGLRQEYNRLWMTRTRRVMDYAVLYHGVGLPDGVGSLADAWPDAVYKYTYYKSRGGLAVMDQDEDWQDQWISMLIARFGWPNNANIMAQTAPLPELKAEIETITDFIRTVVTKAPSHRDFIVKTCAAQGFAA